MAYKCRICGATSVAHEGDVCEFCSIGTDPFADAMGAANQTDYFNDFGGFGSAAGSPSSSKKRGLFPDTPADPFADDISPNGFDDVTVYGAGQAPAPSSSYSPSPSGSAPKAKSGGAISSGITRNIYSDAHKSPVPSKLLKSLIFGIPFVFGDDITMFQVFPDYSGSSLNSMGNSCDQVIVYGKITAGTIAENNEVEVYGRRDFRNNIIAKKIFNKASGTVVTPSGAVSAAAIRVLFVILLILIALVCSGLGVRGLIGAVIIIICIMNLPLVFKLLGITVRSVFSLLGSFLGKR